jgi:hypothetical protein
MTDLAPRLAEYVSHKRVRAGKIIGILPMRVGGARELTIELADGRSEIVEITEELYRRGERTAAVGDYFLVYKDGYRSISPAKAFYEGYELS